MFKMGEYVKINKEELINNITDKSQVEVILGIIGDLNKERKVLTVFTKENMIANFKYQIELDDDSMLFEEKELIKLEEQN